MATDNPQHYAVTLGKASVAFPVDRKEVEFGGQQFVMIQTARNHNGPFGWVEIPYRTELYRVDPEDGIETFVGFVDGK
jgi:hypothetical protein